MFVLVFVCSFMLLLPREKWYIYMGSSGMVAPRHVDVGTFANKGGVAVSRGIVAGT